MNKNEAINNVQMVLTNYEKASKQFFIIHVISIFLSVVLIAAFAYSNTQANKFKEISIELTEKFKYDKSSYLEQKTVDVKLELLRAEIKVRYNISGILGGVILGIGIGGLLNRKKRIANAQAIKSLIYLVNKNP
ncbi:MAG: putative membrane protein YkgB [Psychrobacter glaciei]|jgi:uncharacterized membrane protein YkgB